MLLGVAICVCLGLAVAWVLLWWAFGAHRLEPRRPAVSWAGRAGRARYEAEYAAWVEARWEAEYAAEWVCVYFIEDGQVRVKVGRSVDPDRWLRTLQTGNSARLADRRVRGEWFEAAGLDYTDLLDAVSGRPRAWGVLLATLRSGGLGRRAAPFGVPGLAALAGGVGKDALLQVVGFRVVDQVAVLVDAPP